ncbi:MAG: hypothetical protein ACK50V_01090, partial [Alphaproteobacteria bacterium]
MAEKWLAYKREMNPGDLTEEASQRFREEALALAKLAAGFGAYVVGRAPEDAACMVDAALSYDIFVKDQAMVQEYERKEAAKVEAKAKKSAEVKAFLEQRRLENEEKERVRAARDAEIAAQKQKARDAREKLAEQERARQEKRREKKARPFQARPVEEPNLEDLVRQHYGVQNQGQLEDPALKHPMAQKAKNVKEYYDYLMDDQVSQRVDSPMGQKLRALPEQILDQRDNSLLPLPVRMALHAAKMGEELAEKVKPHLPPKATPEEIARRQAEQREVQDKLHQHGLDDDFGMEPGYHYPGVAPSPMADDLERLGNWCGRQVDRVVPKASPEEIARGQAEEREILNKLHELGHDDFGMEPCDIYPGGENAVDVMQRVNKRVPQVVRRGLRDLGVPQGYAQDLGDFVGFAWNNGPELAFVLGDVYNAYKGVRLLMHVGERDLLKGLALERHVAPPMGDGLRMQYQLKAPVNRGLEGLALERRGFPQGNKLFNAPKAELKGPKMPKGEGPLAPKGPVLHPVDPLPIKAPKAEVPLLKKDPVVRPPEAHRRPEGRGVLPPEPKYNVPPELLRLQRDRLAPLNLERPHMRNLGKKGIGDGG